MTQSTTIIAPASGAGPAGVSVIRVSGPQAGAVVAALAGALPLPRLASLRVLKDSAGAPIDRGLVLWFPGPGSFTGEDVAELQVHGGAAVVAAVLAAACALPGVRPAEPGEFTRRAFLNGRMGLSAAEGLADLIEAETEAQRIQALRQMEGGLDALASGWRTRIVEALAEAEADIDFPDEDLPPGLTASARARIEALRDDLVGHIVRSQGASRVRDGYRVVILGAPNAGKSSLLNALARREAAIVSDIPGTTRDVVEVRLVLGGHVVWVSDTAGLRDTGDAIEAEGVRRALARADEADLRIGLWTEEGERAALAALSPAPDLLLRSKADLAPDGETERAEEGDVLSSLTGLGIEALERQIAARAAAASQVTATAPLTRARHRAALDAAIAALSRALTAPDAAPELAAEDLRLAARAVGRIAGKVDVEDILDQVFSSFCIGK
jgi:tRNA modification GTPase